MFRSLFTRVAMSAAAIAVALASLAAAAPARQHTSALVGTLQKVDGQTLTIQTSKGVETVTLAPGATVHLGTKAMNVSELNAQTGSRVKIRYTENAGQKQAQTVTVSSGKKVTQTARAEAKATPKANRK